MEADRVLCMLSGLNLRFQHHTVLRIRVDGLKLREMCLNILAWVPYWNQCMTYPQSPDLVLTAPIPILEGRVGWSPLRVSWVLGSQTFPCFDLN